MASRLPCGSACVNALAFDALLGSGQSIALWGWGREGQAAYRALRTRSSTSLTLFCTSGEAHHARALNDTALNIETETTGRHLSAFDIVIKSPGISPYCPEAIEAATHGTRFIGGTALWFATRPDARTICVTGTKGKSTTTALLAHLLRAGGHRTALAGNIGLPLLELLDADAEYWAIELSSYQTRDVVISRVRPDIVIVTNLFPEHLDWHGSQTRYIDDKLALLTQATPQIAILNATDPTLSTLQLADSQILWFGREDGWHLRDEWLYRGDTSILDTTSLPLPGPHNRQNLCAVLTAIDALKGLHTADRGLAQGRLQGHFAAPGKSLLAHIATFTPLPHRLQVLGERDGIVWVNDSISTTPHATLAALDVYCGQRIALLIGGFERGLDWSHFADRIRLHPPYTIITLGQTGRKLHTLLAPLADTCGFQLHIVQDLPQAVSLARTTLSPSGGLILLSPGAPSFGPYRDYIERGCHFAELAGFDPDSITTLSGLGVA